MTFGEWVDAAVEGKPAMPIVDGIIVLDDGKYAVLQAAPRVPDRGRGEYSQERCNQICL